MAGAVSPADARAYILERLVGDTGEPDKVVEAGRKLGKRAVAELGERLNQHLSFPLEFDLERIEISRMAETLVDSGENHAVAVAASATSPDALLVDMDSDCVSLLIGAFLGADPEFPAVPIGRALSEIELEMMATVFQEIADAADGPASALKLRRPVQKAFTGPDIAKHVLRDGPAIRIPLVVRSAKSSGRIVMTLPQRVLLQSLGAAGRRMDGKARGRGAQVERHARGDRPARADVARRAVGAAGRAGAGDAGDGADGDAADFAQQGAVRLRVRQARPELFCAYQASRRRESGHDGRPARAMRPICRR